MSFLQNFKKPSSLISRFEGDSFYELQTNINKLFGSLINEPLNDNWQELIGNCAYICKPQTPLTKEWYNERIKLLDSKLEQLRLYPANNPYDCKENGNGYPIEWTEMLGRIFHKVCYKYKDKILNILPISIFKNYR